MSHTCHAKNCNVSVAPRFLMCPMHWRMVPKRLQLAVYAVYVRGQENRKDPTPEYLDAANAAIDAVAAKEGIR